jgi:hypothetical protein
VTKILLLAALLAPAAHAANRGLQYGSGGNSSGVSQIIAGTNVTISPSGGTGAVTVNASGGGSTTGISSSTGAGFFLDQSTIVNGVITGGVYAASGGSGEQNTYASSKTFTSASGVLLTGGSATSQPTAGAQVLFSSGAVVAQSTSATAGYTPLLVNNNAGAAVFKVTQSGEVTINDSVSGGTTLTVNNNAASGGNPVSMAIQTNQNQPAKLLIADPFGTSTIGTEGPSGTLIPQDTNGDMVYLSASSHRFASGATSNQTIMSMLGTGNVGIGFGLLAPRAHLEISSGTLLVSGTAPAISISSVAPNAGIIFVASTTYNSVLISSNGVLGNDGVAPTYSGCGTVTVLSNKATAQAGAISLGGSPGNTCTVTFAKPFINVPTCVVSLGGSLGTGVFGAQGTTTAAAVVGTCDNATGLATCGAGTNMSWICWGQ